MSTEDTGPLGPPTLDPEEDVEGVTGPWSDNRRKDRTFFQVQGRSSETGRLPRYMNKKDLRKEP